MNDTEEELNFDRARFGSKLLPRFAFLVRVCHECQGLYPLLMRGFVTARLQDFADLSCRLVARRGYRDKKPEKELIVYNFLGRSMWPYIGAMS
jgi:hypothetical protein